MGEVGEAGESRFSLIRRIARPAKDAGLPPRDRRELVIEKVAAPDLSGEPPVVKVAAIKKYFETENLDSPLPVLVVAGHHKQPGQGELTALLREKYPECSREDIATAVQTWLDAPDDQKPHKVVSANDPAYPFYQSIHELRQVNESYTLAIAKKIAQGKEDGPKLAKIIAKKSRMMADTNRPQRFHQSPEELAKMKFQTKEHPTSARSAWHFILEKLVKDRPFLQVVIHGMSDRKTPDGQIGYDFVIGAGNTAKGESGRLADPEVLAWFARGLAEKLKEDSLAVAIDNHQEKVETYQGKDGQVTRSSAAKLGKGLSGVGLGLDWFRSGQTLPVENSDKVFTIPGFGDKFNTIQLEISRRVRKDERLRNKAAQAIRELCLEIAEKFRN